MGQRMCGAKFPWCLFECSNRSFMDYNAYGFIDFHIRSCLVLNESLFFSLAQMSFVEIERLFAHF